MWKQAGSGLLQRSGYGQQTYACACAAIQHTVYSAPDTLFPCALLSFPRSSACPSLTSLCNHSDGRCVYAVFDKTKTCCPTYQNVASVDPF